MCFEMAENCTQHNYYSQKCDSWMARGDSSHPKINNIDMGILPNKKIIINRPLHELFIDNRRALKNSLLNFCSGYFSITWKLLKFFVNVNIICNYYNYPKELLVEEIQWFYKMEMMQHKKYWVKS